MATFELDGISFTASKDYTGLATKYGRTDNGDYSDAGEDGVKPFVNAVDIDWNNAQVAGKTMKTSGHVLSEINTIENILLNL